MPDYLPQRPRREAATPLPMPSTCNQLQMRKTDVQGDKTFITPNSVLCVLHVSYVTPLPSLLHTHTHTHARTRKEYFIAHTHESGWRFGDLL